jgi:hypothetical protein
MQGSLSKLRGIQLPLVLARVNLPQGTVEGCTNVPEALALLESKSLLPEAVRVVAHALPKREAVWWACMCAAHTEPSVTSDTDRDARGAAEQWVRRPSEATRRAAMASAKAAAFKSAEAWAAIAAFWSGGSIAEPNKAEVEPAPHLTGTAVSGSVALASIRGNPERRTFRLRRFLESAHNIAAGGPGRLNPEDV